MSKTIEERALELIAELHDEGCVMWSPCDNAADYVCRYCGTRTKTNLDHSIVHHELCMWVKIQQLEKDKV